MKVKLGVVSLGCNKTLVDTQNLIGTLGDLLELTSEDDADYILLNTCSFIKSARDEVRENLDKLKSKRIILVGCYTKFATPEIMNEYPQIWGVIPSSQYHRIGEVLSKIISGKKVYFDFEIESEYLELPGRQSLTLPHIAYIKISEGCNNTCTYCTIPKIRGAYRSRQPINIINEIKSLPNCKEFILTSQDSGYYGKDLEDMNLSKLLCQILLLPGDFNIRLLYLYPERINASLLKVIKESPRIFPYFDIPFQHASEKMLALMKRPKGQKIIDTIRSSLPNAIIRTTFIVGFPGESQEDFGILKEDIIKNKYERIGIFAYSNEAGAESYTFDNQVPLKVKNKRFKELYALSEKISFENNKRLVDSKAILDVIIDAYDPQEDLYICRSYRESPEVDPVIYASSARPLSIGSRNRVLINGCNEYDLFGELT